MSALVFFLTSNPLPGYFTSCSFYGSNSGRQVPNRQRILAAATGLLVWRINMTTGNGLPKNRDFTDSGFRSMWAQLKMIF
jgi:hypothetical protein